MTTQIYTNLKHQKERIAEIFPELIVVNELNAIDPSALTICNKDTLTSLLTSFPFLKTLVLSDTPSFEEGTEVLSMGAKGYANTYIHKEHLLQALNMIESGNIWLYPEFIQHLITQIEPKKPDNELLQLLTERENEIALLISQGATNKEIASELSITERTVKNHLSHIFEKLGVTDRLSLALLVRS